MSLEYQRLPIDAPSAARVAASGLRLDLVDTSDPVAFTEWMQADARGFHEPRMSQASIDAQLKTIAFRRSTGVWDDAGADAASPVATVSAWPADLTVPGERSVPAWAISAVTVAPTHRRKGIARALLEAELRTADALAIPVVMLTVSEATIYSRFGFAPAAFVANWTIETQRAKWAGPEASGRVQFVTLEQLRDEGPDVIERVRLATPGQMTFEGHLWTRKVGLAGGDDDNAKKLRAVRYVDADGVTQGFAVYNLVEPADHDFSHHVVEVGYLVAATADASAGLWRFLLEIDLVWKVTAGLRPTDEPLQWQVTDMRGVYKTHESEHLWTRILDVPAALTARSYASAATFVFDVADALGFAEGRFRLTTADDGSATVAEEPTGPADAGYDADALAITVNDLSALYLGGVSARTLVQAGRLNWTTAQADAVDVVFHSPVTPWLSIWF